MPKKNCWIKSSTAENCNYLGETERANIPSVVILTFETGDINLGIATQKWFNFRGGWVAIISFNKVFPKLFLVQKQFRKTPNTTEDTKT